MPSSTAREAFRRLTRLYAEEEEEETQSWVQERLETRKKEETPWKREYPCPGDKLEDLRVSDERH